jgi:SAM-dependent methyltransferase
MSAKVDFAEAEAPDRVCLACGGRGLRTFYTLRGTPVHSCLLMPTREAALAYPRRDLSLGYCVACGFVTNTLFDSSVHEYSEDYEETQGYSPTFSRFAAELAEQLIARFELRGRSLLEIGCGKGEFLLQLCRAAGTSGLGVDPAYVPGRLPLETDDRLDYRQEFFRPEHAAGRDFVFCRHTLEHIHSVRAFLDQVRVGIGARPEVRVWFDLPDARRVWREGAFWDVYYEHVSYFDAGSLARLFRASGFAVEEIEREYGEQWLSLAARPAEGPQQGLRPMEGTPADTAADLRTFVARASEQLEYWRTTLSSARAAGGRPVVWGGGSKAVAFLGALDLNAGVVEQVVDINPHKTGHYLPGTGQEVVMPEALVATLPSLVVVMNPIYLSEIRAKLAELGLTPDVVAVG